MSGSASARPPVQPPDALTDTHLRFVYASLLFGLAGGLTLAVILPVRAALGRVDLSWLMHAQMHGHLQVVGFAGLFVIGMASRLAPRFGGGRLAYPGLLRGTFWCLAVGLLARALGQPLAAQPAFAVLMAAGGALELVAALLFAVLLIATLRPAIVQRAPHALFMAAGACWLLVQALLGLVWLAELASEGGTVLRSDRNGVLLTMQLYGFLLSVFAGVGLRSFPSFFGMPPPSARLGLAAFALLQVGLVVWTLAGAIATQARGEMGPLTAAGQLLVGIAVLLLISAFGWWRRETRFAAASQPLSWALRGALGSLTLTGALLAVTAVDALLDGTAVSPQRSDAIRHLFAIGVVTLGIVGMAQLILPEFASERLIRQPGRWRGPAFAAALLTAVVLRALLPLAGLDDPLRSWGMALAGLIALVAVAVFGVLFVRARRAHAEYLRRTAAWRAASLPLAD